MQKLNKNFPSMIFKKKKKKKIFFKNYLNFESNELLKNSEIRNSSRTRSRKISKFEFRVERDSRKISRARQPYL